MSFPTPDALEHLSEVVQPTPEQVAAFAETGHVTIRGALDPDVVQAAQPVLSSVFAEHRPDVPPPDERASAYDRAFVQQVNLGRRFPRVAAFTHSRRVAALAAGLLGASGIRLFVEDAFFKEPGCDRTPWHQDASAIPIQAERIVTAWIPLVPVPVERGALQFAEGSHQDGLAGPVDISEESERVFTELVQEQDTPVRTLERLVPGDVSFHAGTTIHAALPNQTEVDREVFALHLFALDARIVAEPNASQRNLLAHLAPDLEPGDRAVSPAWPVLYEEEA